MGNADQLLERLLIVHLLRNRAVRSGGTRTDTNNGVDDGAFANNKNPDDAYCPRGMVANLGSCSDGVTNRRYNTVGEEINPIEESEPEVERLDLFTKRRWQANEQDIFCSTVTGTF